LFDILIILQGDNMNGRNSSTQATSNNSHNSYLFRAIDNRDLGFIKVAIDGGADINALEEKQEVRNTAQACSTTYTTTLFPAGTTIPSSSSSSSSSSSMQLACAVPAVQSPNLLVRDRPLHAAVRTGNLAIVTYLVNEAKVDINLVNSEFKLPIQIAAEYVKKEADGNIKEQRIKIMEILIEKREPLKVQLFYEWFNCCCDNYINEIDSRFEESNCVLLSHYTSRLVGLSISDLLNKKNNKGISRNMLERYMIHLCQFKDLANDDGEQLAGMHAQEFFPLRIYFFYEILVKSYKNPISARELEDKLKEQLRPEILREIETLRIVQESIAILSLNIKIEQRLNLYSILAKRIAARILNEEEIILVGGYRGHTIYINFSYDKQNSKLEIRYDNVGLGVTKKSENGQPPIARHLKTTVDQKINIFPFVKVITVDDNAKHKLSEFLTVILFTKDCDFGDLYQHHSLECLKQDCVQFAAKKGENNGDVKNLELKIKYELLEVVYDDKKNFFPNAQDSQSQDRYPGTFTQGARTCVVSNYQIGLLINCCQKDERLFDLLISLEKQNIFLHNRIQYSNGGNNPGLWNITLRTKEKGYFIFCQYTDLTLLPKKVSEILLKDSIKLENPIEKLIEQTLLTLACSREEVEEKTSSHPIAIRCPFQQKMLNYLQYQSQFHANVITYGTFKRDLGLAEMYERFTNACNNLFEHSCQGQDEALRRRSSSSSSSNDDRKVFTTQEKMFEIFKDIKRCLEENLQVAEILNLYERYKKDKNSEGINMLRQYNEKFEEIINTLQLVAGILNGNQAKRTRWILLHQEAKKLLLPYCQDNWGDKLLYRWYLQLLFNFNCGIACQHLDEYEKALELYNKVKDRCEDWLVEFYEVRKFANADANMLFALNGGVPICMDDISRMRAYFRPKFSAMADFYFLIKMIFCQSSCYIGFIKYTLQKLSDAESAFQSVIKMSQNDTNSDKIFQSYAFYGLGLIKRNLYQGAFIEDLKEQYKQEAIVFLKDAIKLNPYDQEILSNLKELLSSATHEISSISSSSSTSSSSTDLFSSQIAKKRKRGDDPSSSLGFVLSSLSSSSSDSGSSSVSSLTPSTISGNSVSLGLPSLAPQAFFSSTSSSSTTSMAVPPNSFTSLNAAVLSSQSSNSSSSTSAGTNHSSDDFMMLDDVNCRRN
jgi:hypothetical protein